ncbi:MAG TPA: HlyD family secretion protein [Steroidobacteraceae bacterium]|nr:HlyD family secretion protein [Steroidobacteraceae bacterium]
MDAANEAAAAIETDRPSWTRRLLLWGLPLIALLTAVYFYGTAGRYVSTDNAYLQQDRVDVAPQVSGNVREVYVGENTHVVAGQPILALDDSLFRIAVAAAESHLSVARTDVAGLKAAYREKTGEIGVARRSAEFSTREFKRQQELARLKLNSVSQLDAADRTADLATGAVGVLELQRAQTAARLGGNPDLAVDSYPEVLSALAELDHARLDLDRCLIHAPQTGVASHLPKVGNRVEVGRAAFAIVTDRSLWVEANFKETDLEWVRPGQPVEVDVDTYGHRRWRGHVESIAQATGAEFSLLPAQNASGNWVKVVQRIPVRIALDRGPGDPPLRDGMSATVEIDTGPHTRFDHWFGRGR